jgi:hypothetical protein
MNKGLNTVLFIVGATLFNLIIMAVLFIVPLLILIAIFRESLGNVIGVVSIVLFLAAAVGSFFIYGFVMKKVAVRVDMEKYFQPLFRRKR